MSLVQILFDLINVANVCFTLNFFIVGLIDNAAGISFAHQSQISHLFSLGMSSNEQRSLRLESVWSFVHNES